MKHQLHYWTIFLAALFFEEGVDAATARLFSQNVGLLVDTRLDPLVNPGTCSSHVHSVYGNANFGASLTEEMLSFNDADWRNVDGKVRDGCVVVWSFDVAVARVLTRILHSCLPDKVQPHN